jgi:hypothetical protein
MRFIPGDLSDTSLKLGAMLDFLLIGFNIATAVVIYPLVKRLSATLALGYVTARIMETVFIAIGVISIISVLGVNDALAGAGGGEATALVAKATLWWTPTTGPSYLGRGSLWASGTA